MIKDIMVLRAGLVVRLILSNICVYVGYICMFSILLWNSWISYYDEMRGCAIRKNGCNNSVAENYTQVQCQILDDKIFLRK